MFIERIACELQQQGGVKKAFSIKSVEHIYNNRVAVEYVLLEEVARHKDVLAYIAVLDISPVLILSEYKKICKSLKEEIKHLEDKNKKLIKENCDLQKEKYHLKEYGI